MNLIEDVDELGSLYHRCCTTLGVRTCILKMASWFCTLIEQVFDEPQCGEILMVRYNYLMEMPQSLRSSSGSPLPISTRE
jgi:hypothetical protein